MYEIEIICQTCDSNMDHDDIENWRKKNDESPICINCDMVFSDRDSATEFFDDSFMEEK